MIHLLPVNVTAPDSSAHYLVLVNLSLRLYYKSRVFWSRMLARSLLARSKLPERCRAQCSQSRPRDRPAPASTFDDQVLSVPVINLNSFAGNEKRASEAIRRASERVGFFYLSGLGLPKELVTEVFNRSKLFFNLPESVKMSILATKANKNRGYTPYEEERDPDPKVQSVGDQKEGLYFGREVHSTYLSIKLVLNL